MANEPLLVLNAFVLRADSSPASAPRVSRPGYNVNAAGLGSEDDGTRDRRLALTGTPQFEWEAFDEYWRKMHGPKIVHVDGPHDARTASLRYYLQQHRIPAGPSGERPPPYGPDTDEAGLLVRDPAARCTPYARPAWDGIAQLGFTDSAALHGFFSAGPGKYADKIVPDEAVFLRGFAYHLAEEHVVVQRGDRRRDPIVLVKLHRRAQALSRAAFRGRWMAQHAAIVRELPVAGCLVKRYAQLVNIGEPGDALFDAAGDRIDGVGVYSFANMNDCEDFVAGAAQATLAADEREFCADTSFFTALNYVIRDVTA